MIRAYLSMAAVAAALLVGASAQAAFPLATGTCKDRVCFFSNDLIKTRTVGANASQFFVETRNANVSNRFGDRTRELPRVGDSFFQRYSAVTLSEIYASNDVFVTDQQAYDRALELYQRGIAHNNQGLIRAAEVQVRRATATGGTIIGVFGHNQPFELFAPYRQQVPGTEAHPVYVGSNPGNVFARDVADLGHLARSLNGKSFNESFYNLLRTRYDRTQSLYSDWQVLLAKRLEQRAHRISAGKSTARIDAAIARAEERMAKWEERGLMAAARARGLVFGSSTNSLETGLIKLLGKSFDTGGLKTLVGLDLFSNERRGRGAFEQFFPVDKLVNGNSLAFSYISLIRDHGGRLHIGFGVVSQHNRYEAGHI